MHDTLIWFQNFPLMCITMVDLIVTWSKELDTMTMNISVDETLLEENT